MQTQAFREEGKHLGKPGHSLALRYEMLLKELSHLPGGHDNTTGPGDQQPVVTTSPNKRSSLSLTRTNTCFQILDEVLPNLGVYQRVVKQLRDELHAAVYSTEYTSLKGAGREEASMPQQLPYFVLAQKLMSKRASDMSKLKSEIASLQEQLYTCEADLEKASNSLESCRHDIRERDSKIHKLTSDLRLCIVENDRLQKLEGQHQRVQERLRQETDYRMASFRNTITGLKEEKAKLSVYKNTYDRLHDVFSGAGANEMDGKTTVKATPRTELEEQIASADLLKKQLLGMQNALIHEYDIWLNSLTIGEKQSSQIMPAAVILRKQDFQRSISEITTELSLLADHSQCLSERLAQVKEHSRSPTHTALVTPSHPNNPLVPQQQLTNKYSVMIHSSSDGGFSYYSLKEAQQCDSCGQQTVVCPHKVVNGDLVVQLPVDCTHLKITRPALKVTQPSNQTGRHRRPMTRTQKNTDLDSNTTEPDFAKLWSLFKAKFPNFISIVPRNLSPDEVAWLTEQFYGALLDQDDQAALGEDMDPSSILDCLFTFITERYHIEDITPQIVFDFLTALSEHHSEHVELNVLCHVLSGQADGSVFRHLLVLADYINYLPCSSVQEFSQLATILYPFLQEEDIEQLTMNFIAHGNNKISKQLLLEFFAWALLRHREPLVLMLERKLMEHPTSKPGGMLEAEFADAMETLVPTVSDQLCKHLFLQCLVQYRTDNKTKRAHLPVKKLSYIGAYVYTVSMSREVRSKLEGPSQGQTQSSVLKPTITSVRLVSQRVKAISLCK